MAQGIHHNLLGVIVFVAVLAGLSALGMVFSQGGDTGGYIGAFISAFAIILILGLLIGLFYLVGKRAGKHRERQR